MMKKQAFLLQILPYELTTENNEKLKGITNMEGKPSWRLQINLKK